MITAGMVCGYFMGVLPERFTVEADLSERGRISSSAAALRSSHRSERSAAVPSDTSRSATDPLLRLLRRSPRRSLSGTLLARST